MTTKRIESYTVSVSAVPETLIETVRAIPEPRNYYAGTLPPVLEPPRNIVLFRRDTPEHLGPAKALHNRFVLIINCAAAGNVIVDDRSLRLRPGQAILVFPHQFHHYLDIEDNNPRWLFITFEHGSAEQLAALKGLPLAVPATVWRPLADLAAAWNSRGTDTVSSDSRIPYLCALVLLDLLSAAQLAGTPSRPATPQQKRLDPIHRFIASRLEQPFDIDSVARHAGLSPSRLRAVYRAATGISLGRYVSQMRLNRASGLLLNSTMSIKQIAVACGYDSLFSFSRAFKRAMALSPREYRRQHAVTLRDGGSR